MIVHDEPALRIYIGDAQDQLYPHQYLALDQTAALLEHPLFCKLKNVMPVHDLLFLHQIHSSEGAFISLHNRGTILPFKTQGDFLCTQQRSLALGVMTADCLPIAIYDTKQHAIAVVHAGWRGSFKGIARNAAQAILEKTKSAPDHLRVYFGPAANVCCYEVSHDFADGMPAYAQETIVASEKKYFFNLVEWNRLQLMHMGVQAQAIDLTYNYCTMHSPAYFSHRADAQRAGRQMFVVALK